MTATRSFRIQLSSSHRLRACRALPGQYPAREAPCVDDCRLSLRERAAIGNELKLGSAAFAERKPTMSFGIRMAQAQKLLGKVALVTGASAGIGRASAKA